VLTVATEASYQRQRDADELTDDDESILLLMLLFVVVPLIGFSIVIIVIYRRVTSNRTTYCGMLAQHVRKLTLYYTNDKRTCLHTINKLPRRTTQQIPARRPGITTGFSQARSCHTRR